MYTIPKSNYLRRSVAVNNKRTWVAEPVNLPNHEDRITAELKGLGVSKFALGRMESRYLPQIIHADEHLGGVVYGHHEDGYAMLVATDKRVIFLDRKPFYVNEDEISYDIVSGINFSHAGVGSTVTLHTRIREYAFRTFNRKCAQQFVRYIEQRSLERASGFVRNY